MSYRAKITSHVSKSDRSALIYDTIEMRENPQSLYEKSKIYNDTKTYKSCNYLLTKTKTQSHQNRKTYA